MFSFNRSQEKARIGDVTFGGQPGENPTVCLGTLFYGKKWGRLDDKKLAEASRLVHELDKLSERYSVPAVVDLYVGEEDAGEKIGFIAEKTQKPFAIDASSPEARSNALKHAGELGLLDRVIYNSLNVGLTQDEYEALRDDTPKAAILLAYNPKDLSVDGRLKILKDGAGMVLDGSRGLIELAEEIGASRLVDTAATPFGQKPGETLRALMVVKNNYGLPAGCALHNTLESWDFMKKDRLKNQAGYSHASASANTLIPAYSGDFTVFGSIESMKKIIPAVSFTDMMLGEAAREYFGIKPSKKHPLNNL